MYPHVSLKAGQQLGQQVRGKWWPETVVGAHMAAQIAHVCHPCTVLRWQDKTALRNMKQQLDKKL